jgi:hypothetical protein
VNAQAKLKPCPICRAEYRQFSSLDPGCSPECKAEVRRQRERQKAAKEERRETRAALVKLRTVRDWTKLADAEFAKFIRLRDEFQPCISCGTYDVTHALRGGLGWDCGHFRSKGAAPELRYDEANAHKQCKRCNGGSNHYARKRQVVSVEYRERLVARIGLAEVERLEGPYEPKRYRIEELTGIRDAYRSKAKHLKWLRESRASFA